MKIIIIIIALVFIGPYVYSQIPQSELRIIEKTMIGSWESVDDASSYIFFEKRGVYRSAYLDIGGEGKWEIYMSDLDIPSIKVILDDNEYLYSILEVDDEKLSLSYLARGTTLDYIRK